MFTYRPAISTALPIVSLQHSAEQSLNQLSLASRLRLPTGVKTNSNVASLVTDLDAAVRSAKAHDADVIVAPFDDPIGRDAIIEWPGGVRMQLYWHTTAPNYAKLQTIPENRVYLSAERVDEFVRDFVAFSLGTVASDDGRAPGVEIGRPSDIYRRVRIDSVFGTVAVLVTDGHLPYPYGREITGYEVPNLSETLGKAKAAGATVLVAPYIAGEHYVSMVEFPGGFIAEIHSSTRN
jgi:hypothetical protein